MKRCEDEIKEDFFDSLRKELVEIEKRKTENKQLNEAQKIIEKMACFYGIDTDKIKEQTINYIPVRYIVAFMITIFEVLAIIGVMVALCMFVPYFYLPTNSLSKDPLGH